MSRSELARTLLDLVQRKAITPAEMVETLRRFDAGELGDDLPMPVSTEDDDDEWFVVLPFLLLLLGVPSTRTLTKQERERGRRLLRTRFETNMSRLAATVSIGAPVATWHADMMNELSIYTRQMAIAGAGKIPRAETRTSIEQRLTDQWPYLLGFAVQIAVRRVGERPMSPAWISQRGNNYGGTGWGAYFQAQGESALPGWVDVWVTRDDRRVCPRCQPRHQRYFMPNEGPWPGDDCYGTCRCRRLPEYDPVAYARLSGR